MNGDEFGIIIDLNKPLRFRHAK